MAIDVEGGGRRDGISELDHLSEESGKLRSSQQVQLEQYRVGVILASTAGRPAAVRSYTFRVFGLSHVQDIRHAFNFS